MEKKLKKKKPKKKRMIDLAMMVLLLVGVAVLLYPFVNNTLNQFLDQQVINYYQKQANEKNKQAIEDEREKLEAENKKIAEKNNPGSDPFSNKEAVPITPSKDYYEIHTIALIRIPKINVHLPIFDETNDLFLKRGASLLDGTSYPTGGENTHAVISAHRGLPEATLFSDLPELEKGNQFFIEINQEILAYEVDQIKTIEPTETEVLKVIEGEDKVTLMTCTPYMINSHRLLVRGKRIPYEPAMAEAIQKSSRYWKWKQYGALSGMLVIIIITLEILYHRVKTMRIAKRVYDVDFYFQAENGRPLANKKFGVHSRNGKKLLYRNRKPLIVTTNRVGHIHIPHLRGGIYQLKTQGVSLIIYVSKVKDPCFRVKKTKGAITKEYPRYQIKQRPKKR